MGKQVAREGVHVRPSLKTLHGTVTKMAHVEDEQIVRNIVSCL